DRLFEGFGPHFDLPDRYNFCDQFSVDVRLVAEAGGLPSSRAPKTFFSPANPARGNFPSACNSASQLAAKSVLATRTRPNLAASFSNRAARFTAGPMQVKSSRLPPPMLPYNTFPTCSANPKRAAPISVRVG